MPGHYDVTLTCGVSISLTRIVQYRTYGGLYEGLPNREMNEEVIQEAISSAESQLYLPGAPHLIPPEERKISLPENHRLSRDSERTPIVIPSIACLASFESFGPARDADADMSSMRIVWFQEEFALPIEPTILAKLQALDWRQLATDGHY